MTNRHSNAAARKPQEALARAFENGMLSSDEVIHLETLRQMIRDSAKVLQFSTDTRL